MKRILKLFLVALGLCCFCACVTACNDPSADDFGDKPGAGAEWDDDWTNNY